MLLENFNIDYVLHPVKPEHFPINWDCDNKVVCTFISQVVDPSNFRLTRPHRKGAAKTWEALRIPHQDWLAGGRKYWLRKLSVFKMEGDGILVHIDAVAKVAEKLDALITPNKQLTIDEIHPTALLTRFQVIG